MVAEMGSEAHSPPSVAVGSQSPGNTSAATTISYPPRPEQQEGERPRKDLAKMDVTQFISELEEIGIGQTALNDVAESQISGYAFAQAINACGDFAAAANVMKEMGIEKPLNRMKLFHLAQQANMTPEGVPRHAEPERTDTVLPGKEPSKEPAHAGGKTDRTQDTNIRKYFKVENAPKLSEDPVKMYDINKWDLFTQGLKDWLFANKARELALALDTITKQ